MGSLASVIGVDPGLTGALALLTNGQLVTVLDIPVWDMDGKNCVNPKELNLLLWELVHDADCDDNPLILIEKAQTMPKQGIVTGFNYGESFGTIHSVCWLTGLRVQFVRPGDWKRRAKLLKSSKHASLDRARQMFPDKETLFKLKKHHNRAEAALIGMYGRAP